MRKKLRSIMIYVLVVLLLILSLFPIIWTFLTSIKSNADIFSIPPKIVFQPTLFAWKLLYTIHALIPALINGIIIAGANSLLSVLLGTLAAYALLRLGSRKIENHIAMWAFSNRALPPIVVAVPLYVFFWKLHLFDTHFALIIAFLSFNLPFALWTMRGYLEMIPKETEEAAMIDGCSRLGLIFRIVLPMARHGLLTVTTFCFIFSWNEFLLSAILTTRRANPISTLAILFTSQSGILWSSLSSLVIFQTFPIIIVVFLVQRSMVRGLTLGAIK